MENKQEMTNERKIEKAIGWILRLGVAFAVIIMLIGIILLLIHGSSGYNKQIPTDLGLLMAGLVTGKAAAWLMAGIFVLILTPTVRVFASIFAFMAAKDLLYVAITTFVFIILVFAAFIGLKG